ncbi:MAG: hypothetical protein ACRDRN_03750 [Sciscionella sp.]
MTLSFRNASTSPDDPVGEWPTEAVQAALERGDLQHWQRLATAIQGDPLGRTARQIEEIHSHSRPYGVADLMERVIARASEQRRRNARPLPQRSAPPLPDRK